METFGSPINQNIADQLESRSKIAERESKSRKDLLFLNSNTGWIKIRSSINDVTGEKKDASLQYGFFSFERLQGPARETEILSSNSDARNNIISSDQSAGIQRPGSLENPVYKNSLSRGFRPKPGITGFSIFSKNTYGTLREAEISFTVWTLEDFEIYEKLYFRPGFSILVEWGHSVYVDNKGNLNTSPSTIDDKLWFNKTSIEKIESEISAKRINSNHNYDGFFGYIYNFNWKLRDDGGYDCSLKVVSKGLILESIKIPKSKDYLKNEELKGELSEETLRKRKSFFHFVFNELEKVTKIQFTNKDEAFKNVPTLQGLEEFKIFRHNIQSPDTFGVGDKKSAIYYIKLKTLLDLFNYGSLYIKNFDGKQNYKNEGVLVKFDTSLGEKYSTFDNHFSLDPFSCALPKTPTEEPYKNFTLKNLQVRKASIEEVDNITSLMQADVNDQSDDIMNIMISTKLIESELNKVIEGPQDTGNGFYDALIGILSKVQSDLGEINNFSVIYDEKEVIHRIVDRNAFTQTISAPALPILPLTGLKSLLTSVNISSKISNQMASQIAIAAQGVPGNYDQNVSAILQWNSNIVDRHINYKGNTTEDPEIFNSKSENTSDQEFLKQVERVYSLFNRSWGKGSFNGSPFTDIHKEGITLLQKKFRNYTIATKDKKDTKSIGTIPVELEIKTLGISGLKPGNTFKISKNILPSRFDNWGYIITGLTDSIENGKWYTTIKTQFYKI